MRTYKTHFIAILTGAACILASIGVFNFTIDPYQIYRKASLYQPLFFANQRYQNAGLINSYLGGNEGYDTVLIGTSRSANTSSAVAQRILRGGKVLKLCIGGGRLSELSLILKSALHTGKVKRVIFETAWPMTIETEDMWHPSYPFPVYLYTSTIIDDWPYLFDFGVTAKSIHLLTGLHIPGSNISRDSVFSDPDKIGRWMELAVAQNAFQAFNSPKNLAQKQHSIDTATITSPPQLQTSYPGVDKHILPLVRQYPEVQFNFAVYPSETAFFASMENKRFARHFYLRRYLVGKLEKHSNATIYAYDTQHDFVLNLANYASVSHAGEPVNYLILQSIHQQKDILTPKTLPRYEERFLQRVANYHVYSSFQHVVTLSGDSDPLPN